MASILVADDELNVRQLLRRILEKAGHRVTEANDGEQVMARLHEKKFDLVIIDVVMPIKGGIETLIDMREDFRGIKIIIISGKVDTSSTAFTNLTAHFGAQRVMRKPFETEQLLREVNSLLAEA